MESNRIKDILVTAGLGFISHLYNQDKIKIKSIVDITTIDYSGIKTL